AARGFATCWPLERSAEKAGSPGAFWRKPLRDFRTSYFEVMRRRPVREQYLSCVWCGYYRAETPACHAGFAPIQPMIRERDSASRRQQSSEKGGYAQPEWAEVYRAANVC